MSVRSVEVKLSFNGEVKMESDAEKTDHGTNVQKCYDVEN